MGDQETLLGRIVAGKFQVEERIGRGAMGEVFRARHIVLDTHIALKIMRADIAEQAMFKERFYREAKAASRLDHPNSVRVLDFGVEPDGLTYIAMELLHGRDLLGVLRDEWPLPDERVVEILVQTLAAVSVAHELGIIHRDLKPENIMVHVGREDDEHGPWQVKVLDFGIAKLTDPRSFQTENGGSLTSSGTLIGTPEYMSPEQSRGDSLDFRSDIYSVGIILYQLLVGRVPFSAENALGVVLKQVTDEPVPPTEVRPGVNPRLEAICLRALKKSREERYQTAKEMRRDLRAVFGYAPNQAGEESGARLPPVRPAAPARFDTSSAETLLQTPEPSEKQSGGTLPMLSAPRATREEPSRARSYVGLIIAVAFGALVLGGLVVFAAARRGTSRAAAASSEDASAEAGNVLAVIATPQAMPSAELAAPLPVVSTSAHHAAPPHSGAHAPVTSKSAATAAAVAVVVDAAVPAATGAPYNPSSAIVALGTTSTERVRQDAIRSKVSALSPQLTQCYHDALLGLNAPQGGSVPIHMSIDEHGNVMAVVESKNLQAFAACAQRVLAGLRIDPAALDPDSGGANATQWLVLRP